uniref:Fatty acid desaturase domain-containing protein n=1 Tax=Chromera velia CCMP2878 TaxID=1169474 RepID=A0A0G4F0F7_9ALVE|eukprot:Cvel_2615.t1-p1 / transcript=Cvel_2615.t1 / gene=Cvel_2615 / organism=Chromera_velia_CCMP2878 / gene_product=Omega-3 fatty acid desaturase, endoplasmic, putative / transcript_product=Omega-3 fatty acid desaturase, endoplasmic, putative / location=Cvel_scaffold103:107120-110809(+) / protein_length=461 / sequence_SO=supercontig / SO=protein_coding / is_pseudo=false
MEKSPTVQYTPCGESPPLAPPPFTLKDVRDAIPKHCWVKDPIRSVSFFFRDCLIVAALAAIAWKLDHPLVYPLYWVAQGTMFWALFVIGHDCGHGSFSDSKVLNDIVGHISHSFILVPFHGWRISHRTHHNNHGHIHNDESWFPMQKQKYTQLEWYQKAGRFQLPTVLFGYILYLFVNTPGKPWGSHFHPGSRLFKPSEATDVITSTTCWLLMVALLCWFGSAFGFWKLFSIYLVPYVIGTAWLVVVTFLHHTEKNVPWFQGEEWSYLRGALSTLDRDYGFFNSIHHNIETHVVHHIFPAIPHYHLVEATEAVKPLLGKYYVEPEKCTNPVNFPMHLVKALSTNMRECRYVEDEGTVFYYKSEADLDSVSLGSGVKTSASTLGEETSSGEGDSSPSSSSREDSEREEGAASSSSGAEEQRDLRRGGKDKKTAQQSLAGGKKKGGAGSSAATAKRRGSRRMA